MDLAERVHLQHALVPLITISVSAAGGHTLASFEKKLALLHARSAVLLIRWGGGVAGTMLQLFVDISCEEGRRAVLPLPHCCC